jgi:hypothetical protein
MIIFYVVTNYTLLAQNYGRGLTFNDKQYDKTQRKVTLMTRDYGGLPNSFSLKKYCPTPRSQGQYGTCVGWSTTWGARTILEAKTLNVTDTQTITEMAFSPHFTYQHIKDAKEVNCQNGTYIDDALTLLKTKGAPKFTDYSTQCPQDMPDDDIYEKAVQNKIKGHARLFDRNETKDFKVQTTKKALVAGNPVLIGMLCPDSFNDAKDLWTPKEVPNNNMGGHAMCVIGYDDNKYGGAFEILNSWGTNWGNKGYTWVTYDTYYDFVKYAYEAIAIPSQNNNNNNNIAVADLEGSLKMETADSGEMTASFVRKEGNVGVYRLNKPYFSGTKFRIYISNEQPAFVYALGSDVTTEKVDLLFPFNENISPALNYKGNNVALPSEKHFIKMNNVTGTDYLCLIYSKKNYT